MRLDKIMKLVRRYLNSSNFEKSVCDINSAEDSPTELAPTWQESYFFLLICSLCNASNSFERSSVL